MDPEQARQILAEAAIELGAEPLCFEPRDGRWLARLPGERIAWLPRDPEGAARLARERRVLRLLDAYCGFEAPRVLAEGEGGWDVRSFIPSEREPFDVFHQALREPGLALRLGRRLGEMLAEQHGRIPAEALAGDWLPARPGWPDPAEIPHLHAVLADEPALLARARRCLDRWRALPPAPNPVLVHGDLGLHNIAFWTDGTPRGLFDYDGAWRGDACEDFKLLILAGGVETVLEAALDAYEPVTGVRIDRVRVRLLHAAAAVGFLAFRHGHPPEEPWCGRTLAEDLAWTDGALTAIGL